MNFVPCMSLLVQVPLNDTHLLDFSLVSLRLHWQSTCSLFAEWSSMVIDIFLQLFWLSELLHCYILVTDTTVLGNVYATGTGLDVDEYVRKSYKFAYSDCIEVGPLACLPEPPDPNDLYAQKSSRQVHIKHFPIAFIYFTKIHYLLIFILDFLFMLQICQRNFEVAVNMIYVPF